MGQEHYDAVIVGRDLAGLVCAVLLARRKMRVRLLTTRTPPTPPDDAPLFGLQTSPVVRRVLDEVGLVHATRTRLDGPPRPIALALPDRRLQLEPEAAARGQALGAAFPGLGGGLVQLFDRIEGYGASLDPMLDGTHELPPDGFTARRAYRKLLAAMPAQQLLDDPPTWSADPTLQGLVAVMLAAAGRFDRPAGFMTAGGARALWHLCHGVAPLRGGRAGFESMLREKLQTFGGAVEGRKPTSAVEVHRRRFEAVLCSEDTRLTADAFVFADDAATLGTLWEDADPPTRTSRSMRAQVAEGDRPVDLRDPCAWLSDDAGPCLVRVDPDGLSLRWASGPPPDLERLAPFANAKSSEPADASAPARSFADPLGLARRPMRGPLKNMLWIGETVLPGLGLEGPFLGALLAADAVERMLPRKRRSAAR